MRTPPAKRTQRPLHRLTVRVAPRMVLFAVVLQDAAVLGDQERPVGGHMRQRNKFEFETRGGLHQPATGHGRRRRRRRHRRQILRHTAIQRRHDGAREPVGLGLERGHCQQQSPDGRPREGPVLESGRRLVCEQEVLTAGMVAGFWAGSGDGHQLVNRSSAPARSLELSNRHSTDFAEPVPAVGRTSTPRGPNPWTRNEPGCNLDVTLVGRRGRLRPRRIT